MYKYPIYMHLKQFSNLVDDKGRLLPTQQRQQIMNSQMQPDQQNYGNQQYYQ